LGQLHFWVTFISSYLVFFPMYYMGMSGVPRRYYSFTEFEFSAVWADVNVMITWAAILGVGIQLVFIYNFFSSIWLGKKATRNPWNSTGLEWSTPVERIHGNWPGRIPTVHRWPYDYSKPGAPADFIPQWLSDEDVKSGVRYWEPDYDPDAPISTPAPQGADLPAAAVEAERVHRANPERTGETPEA
jgi:cytochrome c oxidase subunit 1